MKIKKLLAMVLSASIVMSGASVSVKAAKTGETKAEPVQTAVPEKRNPDVTAEKLAKVTKIIKGKITIPKEFTEFNYELQNESGTDQLRYYFNWSREDQGDSIQVESDDQGRVISYFYFPAQSKNSVPKYKKNQLQGNVEQFLKKVMPESTGKVKLLQSNFEGIYSGKYSYTYERMENGIPLPENAIHIGVSYETGEIVSYQSIWDYKLTIPSAKISFNEKEAKEKLKSKLEMNLAYYSTYVTDKDGKSKEKIFLAFTPDNASLAVDAATGKIYPTKGEKDSNPEPYPYAKAENAADKEAGAGALTGQEIKKIDDITNILTAKDATAVVKKNTRLLLDQKATAVTTRLYQSREANGKSTSYQWNITFNLPKDAVQTGYYATARVDAKTGKILSYHSSRPWMDESQTVKPKYTKEEAEKQMESFLRSQWPEYFAACVKSKEVTEEAFKSIGEEESSYRYVFDYYRTYKNIPYYGNGMNGEMDMKTGKIFSFSCNWDKNAVFEEPEKLISEQAAEEAYLSFGSTPLIYEINWKNNNPEVRLVYRTMIPSCYVSPFTGKQLDYNGLEYKAGEKNISYQDIGDSFAKESIELLADMNLGFSGGLFYPKKAITVEEWNMLAGEYMVSYAGSQIIKEWDTWSNEKQTVTRLNAAKYCVIICGMNKAAVLPDIYQVTYNDKDKIAQKDAGYVMLAKGLGLMSGDSQNNFNPEAPVTREEAAQIIVKLISQRE